MVSPEKKAEKTTQKALEEERFDVLQFPKKIGRYLGVAEAAAGLLLLILFALMTTTGKTSGILLSSETSPPSIAVWCFVGLINVIVGLLFMGRD